MEENRRDFFAIARACRRATERGTVRVSGAKFTSLVKLKDWGYADDGDRQRAAEAIETMTHVHPAGS